MKLAGPSSDGSSVEQCRPTKDKGVKAAAGKYAYSSRIKWLHIDDKTQVGHGKNLDITTDNLIGKYYR